MSLTSREMSRLVPSLGWVPARCRGCYLRGHDVGETCTGDSTPPHSMAALRGGHPGQHAAMFGRVTLDSRVKPGYGVYEGLHNQFPNVIPAKAGICPSL